LPYFSKIHLLLNDECDVQYKEDEPLLTPTSFISTQSIEPPTPLGDVRKKSKKLSVEKNPTCNLNVKFPMRFK